MAETDDHRELMGALIQVLAVFFALDPLVYVSGNLLLFYERGNRRRHVSPDVFVVKGVPKRRRPNYLIWEEGRGPAFVIELTSSSTKDEDLEDKYRLYQDVLCVPEYFLFDPHGDYLNPPLRGYRLEQGQYVAIEAVDGRLPSAVLGLHLERHGGELRLYNPVTRHWLLTSEERRVQAEAEREQEQAARRQAEEDRQREEAARRQAEAEREQEQAARLQAEADREREQAARRQAEAETERLRREIEELRRRLPGDA
jgi:Uma2 family endonuclease